MSKPKGFRSLRAFQFALNGVRGDSINVFPMIPMRGACPSCTTSLYLPDVFCSDSDSANAAISVSISSPEDLVEWMFSFSSLWQYDEPKLRQTNHYKDWDRQKVKGGESFSRFLLYRKICPQRQPTLRVGAKLAAQYVLRPCCSLEFCLLAALVSQNSIKKHNRYEYGLLSCA